MHSSSLRPRLVALLAAIVVSVGLPSLSATPACAAAGTITWFNNPSGQAFGITTGPDGNLWFTDRATPSIGRITTSGSFTEFTIPTANIGPDAITAGPDCNL